MWSGTDVRRSVESEPKVLSGWYSLTVDSDEMRECEREWQLVLVEVYEDRLLRLSEKRCLGDLGDPVTLSLVVSIDVGAAICCWVLFLTFKVRGSE